MLNALLGFEYVHGTYPDPTAASPNSTPGGFTQAEWQTIQNDPEAYALAHPDIVNVQTYGDTRYVTVTPKVLPLVSPLHSIGLTPLADLIEPALRVTIEETGYDRSIPYGQPTPFRLIPIFNPITLAADVGAAIPQGVTKALTGLGLVPPVAPPPPPPLATPPGYAARSSATAAPVTKTNPAPFTSAAAPTATATSRSAAPGRSGSQSLTTTSTAGGGTGGAGGATSAGGGSSTGSTPSTGGAASNGAAGSNGGPAGGAAA